MAVGSGISIGAIGSSVLAALGAITPAGWVAIGAVAVVGIVTIGITYAREKSEKEDKSSESKSIGRRKTYSSRKKAKEAAKRAGEGKEPRHDPNGHKNDRIPHFHPNVPDEYRVTPKGSSSHDHYYYPG